MSPSARASEDRGSSVQEHSAAGRDALGRSGGGAAHEYVLVGGGLQNALIALALLERRPETRLAVVEREPRLGGNHTWCFHAGDVPADVTFVDRLVERRWPSHEVIFPKRRRHLPLEYAAITSERLHRELVAALAAAPNAELVTGSARDVQRDQVTLEDGRVLRAELVIDARGPERVEARAGGYQKFVGLELAVAEGTAPERPVLMDATVAQVDGFRFMYVLPWATDRVLVEDTYYSTSPALDVPALRARVLEHAARAGLGVRGVIREEQGVLPIPLELELEAPETGPLRAGYAGGLFHPTTGYSLPVATRLARFIAARPARAALGADHRRWLAAHRRQARFCLLLNRLMFGGFAPEQRFNVLERFYGLPEDTIVRFYALDTRREDRARIICGRPPRGFSLRRLLAGGHPA